MTSDFFEVSPPFPFIERKYCGPSIIESGRTEPFRDRIRLLQAKVNGKNSASALSIWLDMVDAAGGLPNYGPHVLRAFAPIARNVGVREREANGWDICYRYIGQELVERFGREMTGQSITVFNGQSVADSWTSNRELMVEGRPCAFLFNYGQHAKIFLHAGAVMLPFGDPATGEIRFSVEAVDYYGSPQSISGNVRAR